MLNGTTGEKYVSGLEELDLGVSTFYSLYGLFLYDSIGSCYVRIFQTAVARFLIGNSLTKPGEKLVVHICNKKEVTFIVGNNNV
jgi:hypothetical protein